MNHKWLRLCVQIGVVIGMLCGIALLVYVTARILPQEVGSPAADGCAKWQTIASYVLAVFCFLGVEYIAYTLLTMMRSLDGDPFVQANVKALRHMGIAAIGVAIGGILTVCFRPVPLAVLAALPVGMCGLFSLVLSGVFEQAVAYKRENDLTI